MRSRIIADIGGLMPGKILIHIPYTTVWSTGEILTTRCSVKDDTKEVFNIEISDYEPRGFCEREYITVGGVEYDVVEKDARPEGYKGHWRF